MNHLWRAFGLCSALAMAACSANDDGSPRDQAEPMTESPDVAPSAAPGVAFRFGYDFRLTDEKIDDLQEAHANRCESLGLQRCRITGLQYHIDDQDRVTGMLQVKLDPRIARQFGKEAVASVEENGGKLVNAYFSGEDEGSQIDDASARKADIEERIAALEKGLAGMAAGDRERAQIQEQIERLRSELGASRQTIATSEQRLALTPVTLNYYGKGGVPGFRGRDPIDDSFRAFIDSSVTMISSLLYFVAILLPWALLLLLLVILYRSRVGRWVRGWWQSSSYVDTSSET